MGCKKPGDTGFQLTASSWLFGKHAQWNITKLRWAGGWPTDMVDSSAVKKHNSVSNLKFSTVAKDFEHDHHWQLPVRIDALQCRSEPSPNIAMSWWSCLLVTSSRHQHRSCCGLGGGSNHSRSHWPNISQVSGRDCHPDNCSGWAVSSYSGWVFNMIWFNCVIVDLLL